MKYWQHSLQFSSTAKWGWEHVNKNLGNKITSVQPSYLVAYWPLDDSSGLVARDTTGKLNGTYAASGITYQATGIGDNKPAVSFDGNNTYVQVGNTGLNTLWNGNIGSAIAWAKVANSGIWTDSASRWIFHIRSSADSTYYITFGRDGTNNALNWRRRSGGAITQVSKTSYSTTGWFCMGMTWDTSVPEIRAYLNGDYIGNAVNNMTAWGTTNPVEGGTSVAFAGSTTLQEWIGSGAHVALWAGIALPDTTMKYLTSFS